MKRMLVTAVALLFALVSPDSSLSADGNFLAESIEKVCKEYDIPAMSAVLVIDGIVTGRAAGGVRKYGTTAAVQQSDPFMLCSATKPLTATLVYILIEKKMLGHDTKILDVFPELAASARPEYRDATIDMLLTHRAGFPYKPKTEPGDEWRSTGKTMMERRYEYVKAALVDEPDCAPGEKIVYSGGTIILAAMMEKKTGTPWEVLIRKYLFSPLGMTTAGFGAMEKKGPLSGVWEHALEEGRIVPQAPPDGYDDEVHAPAGRNVHMSAEDAARFLIASLPYHVKGPRILGHESQVRMQTLYAGGYTTPGWFVSFDGWSEYKTVCHTGDNGKSLSVITFAPKLNSGLVIMANCAGKRATEGLNALEDLIRKHIAEQCSAKKITAVHPFRNRALNPAKGMTASEWAGSSSDYAPDKLADGIILSRWAGNGGTKEAWIEADLGKPLDVDSVLIIEEADVCVESYEVQVRSDPGGTFVTVARGGAIGDEVIVRFNKTKARYVRLTVRTTKETGPTLSEFMVFGPGK